MILANQPLRPVSAYIEDDFTSSDRYESRLQLVDDAISNDIPQIFIPVENVPVVERSIKNIGLDFTGINVTYINNDLLQNFNLGITENASQNDVVKILEKAAESTNPFVQAALVREFDNIANNEIELNQKSILKAAEIQEVFENKTPVIIEPVLIDQPKNIFESIKEVFSEPVLEVIKPKEIELEIENNKDMTIASILNLDKEPTNIVAASTVDTNGKGNGLISGLVGLLGVNDGFDYDENGNKKQTVGDKASSEVNKIGEAIGNAWASITGKTKVNVSGGLNSQTMMFVGLAVLALIVVMKKK